MAGYSLQACGWRKVRSRSIFLEGALKGSAVCKRDNCNSSRVFGIDRTRQLIEALVGGCWLVVGRTRKLLQMKGYKKEKKLGYHRTETEIKREVVKNESTSNENEIS